MDYRSLFRQVINGQISLADITRVRDEQCTHSYKTLSKPTVDGILCLVALMQHDIHPDRITRSLQENQ